MTDFEFPAFQVHRALAQRHVQTVFGTVFPRRFGWATAWRQAAEPREFVMPDGDRLTGVLHAHPADPGRHRPLLILLSGLEGNADTHYMQGMSAKAFGAGFHSLRLNYRTCGGTEHMARRMYNGGLIEDIDVIIRQFAAEAPWPIVIAGVSLGANKVLRLLGTYGEQPPPGLMGGVAISPPIDLSVTARTLTQGLNRMYDAYFIRTMKKRLRRILALRRNSEIEMALLRQGLTVRTVRAFDETVTAPMGRFIDAADYYEHASTGDLVGAIRVPALLIHAKDDPLIPMSPFEARAALLDGNPYVTTVFTETGGHVGFIQAAAAPRSEPWMDAYWAENAAVAYVQWLDEQRGYRPAGISV
jgi:predicted alpha/beta-fold hydrolase